MTAATPTMDERKRFSLEVLQDSRGWRVAFGIILAGAMIGAVLFIVAAFTGKLTNVMKVRGELPGTGNALPVGSLVLYRNVTVGKIASEGIGPNGTIAITFDLYPAKAADVPSNVVALVSPLSIFGNQAVDLVIPTRVTPSAQAISATSFVAADGQTSSTSLQQTTTQLFTLLNAVQPANLDKALTAFATALNGEGTKLGQTLDSADTYLKTLNPLLPTLNADVNLLPPVAGPLNTAAPNIIGTLGNTTTTAHTLTGTISNGTADLTTLLGSGDSALSKLTTLLDAVQNTLPNLINGSGPLLRDLNGGLPPNQVSNLLSRTLAGLRTFASAVAASETTGPFLAIHATLPVANVNAAVEAALDYGSPSQLQAELAASLGTANFNPTPYSAADCPTSAAGANPLEDYGAGMQTNCSGDSPAISNTGTDPSASASARVNTAAATTATSSPGTAPLSAEATIANPFDAEVYAAQSIATALNGGRAPAVPAEDTMVLVPLYASMAAG